MEAAKGNGHDKYTKSLIIRLTGATNSYKRALSDIGVNINDDGYMSIDEDKMKSAAKDGTMEKFFVGDDKSPRSGFSGKISSLMDNLSKNPTRYVSPFLRSMPGFSDTSSNYTNKGSSQDDNKNQSDYLSYLFNSLS